MNSESFVFDKNDTRYKIIFMYEKESQSHNHETGTTRNAIGIWL